MLDPRIYRAALLPALLALIVVAFSLESRPEPLRTSFAPEAFDGARAARTLDRLAREFPSRRPGSAGDAALARRVAGELRAVLPKVPVRTRTLRGRTIDGERELITVSASSPGRAPGAQVALVAGRDAADRGARAQLSGTAALIELARVLAETRPARTITFASVSGSSGGQEGMRDLAARLDRPVDALIELGDLAGPGAGGRSPVVGWSDGIGAAPQRLQRTVALALRIEAGVDTAAPSARGQLARFAAPLSVSGQGVADAGRVPAVRVSASGELPPASDAPTSAARLERFGRAALRSLTALDGGSRAGTAPSRDLVIARKVLPAWAVRVLAAALLLPALLTAIDGLARLRRRREPVLRHLGWVLALAAPFLLAGVFARLLGVSGVVDATAPPAPPGAVPLDGSAWVALGCTALVLALAALLVRPVLGRVLGVGVRPDEPGAQLAPVLVACALGVAACAVNPYAALLLVLPANLWLVLATPELPLRRPLAVALVLASLAPVVLIPLAYAEQLDQRILEAPWFWLLTVAGGQGGPWTLVAWALAAGASAAALLLALRPRRPVLSDRPVTVRGPLTYAGPGSLGGTDSALRRTGVGRAARSDFRRIPQARGRGRPIASMSMYVPVLRSRIARGEYAPDPRLVADAILRRLLIPIGARSPRASAPPRRTA